VAWVARTPKEKDGKRQPPKVEKAFIFLEGPQRKARTSELEVREARSWSRRQKADISGDEEALAGQSSARTSSSSGR
jgi:hypothetical protein